MLYHERISRDFRCVLSNARPQKIVKRGLVEGVFSDDRLLLVGSGGINSVRTSASDILSTRQKGGDRHIGHGGGSGGRGGSGCGGCVCGGGSGFG